jgi:hypothetical protein
MCDAAKLCCVRNINSNKPQFIPGRPWTQPCPKLEQRQSFVQKFPTLAQEQEESQGWEHWHGLMLVMNTSCEKNGQTINFDDSMKCFVLNVSRITWPRSFSTMFPDGLWFHQK